MRANELMDFPLAVFTFSLIALLLSVQIGLFFRGRWRLKDGDRGDFDVILAAALTLLGLIIGFSFSMALSRYDQRKNYEEEEANAIGTEHVRSDLLPAADAARVSALLRTYLNQRILFYEARDRRQLRQINADTSQVQAELWHAVRGPSAAQPTALSALVLSGMNDVINSQGYTQAAWWNRIPISAWGLMAAIAICCNLMIGYGARCTGWGATLLIVMPLLVSISFLLIADIDSPRGGLIRVNPQNLVSLSQSWLPAP